MQKRFTFEDTALLLIDHQQGTVKLAKNIPQETIEQNARALLRMAKATGMPVVLTTSNETQFQGPLFDWMKDLAPTEFEARVKRPGMVNAWEYPDFKKAVLATGKKNLVMAGLTNDVCTVFPAMSAVAEGFAVQVVVDAGGSPTAQSDQVALDRMEANGVVLTGTNQIMAELAYDWSTENGGKVLGIMYEEILSKLVS